MHWADRRASVAVPDSLSDARMAGIGALPPFTGTKAKDPLPPSCGVPVGRHEGQLWVRLRKAHSEHFWAGVPQEADPPGGQGGFRVVPIADIRRPP